MAPNGFQVCTLNEASGQIGLAPDELLLAAQYLGIQSDRFNAQQVEELKQFKKSLKGRSVQAFIASQPNQHNPQRVSNQPESTTDRIDSEISPFNPTATLTTIAQNSTPFVQEYQGLSDGIVNSVDAALTRITDQTVQAIESAPARGLEMLAARLGSLPKQPTAALRGFRLTLDEDFTPAQLPARVQAAQKFLKSAN